VLQIKAKGKVHDTGKEFSFEEFHIWTAKGGMATHLSSVLYDSASIRQAFQLTTSSLTSKMRSAMQRRDFDEIAKKCSPNLTIEVDGFKPTVLASPASSVYSTSSSTSSSKTTTYRGVDGMKQFLEDIDREFEVVTVSVDEVTADEEWKQKAKESSGSSSWS
jgi:ketosteroid isomerase-like protein